MKLVHLCLGKANPDRMNGVNVVVDALATAQSRQDIEVTVWGITENVDAETPRRAYPLSLFRGAGRRFKMPDGMGNAIEGLPADSIVHFHGVMTPVFYTIARALKKRRIAWVVTPHGAYNTQSMRKRAWGKYPYVLMVDQFVLRNARAIHLGVAGEMNTVAWICRNTPHAVVTNGQTVPAINDNQLLPRQSRPIFGYVGRLAMRHKGLDILIDGFAGYIKAGGQGTLWIIGDGDDRGQLEKRVAGKGIGKNVDFLGAQFGDEKQRLIQAMDIFVHTSRWEMMPMAVLEAASFSVPLLLSKPTNMGGHVQDNDAGFVLDNNNGETLCQMMLDIDKKLALLPLKGQNARSMIENDFSWDRVAQTIMTQVYKG